MDPKGKSAAAPPTSAKPRRGGTIAAPKKSITPWKRKLSPDHENDEEGNQGAMKRPSKRARKPTHSTSTSAAKGKAEVELPTDVEEEAKNDAGSGADDADNTQPSVSNGRTPELLLAKKWNIKTGPNPTGWWMSEKLDGVRTHYDGSQFLSHLGLPFAAPDWFLDKLPKDVALDGELYGGRGEYEFTALAVQSIHSAHWTNITFQIFDIPSIGARPFEERYAALQERFGAGGTQALDHIAVVEHELVKDRAHVLTRLGEVESQGGEGVMLRRAGPVYKFGRSDSFLEVKIYNAEAVVMGYVPRKPHKGALMCKMESGKLFNVDSGLTKEMRKAPPPIGSIISYRFQQLTQDGIPRFPTFIGVAINKDAPKDAVILDRRKAATAGTSAEEV